jgi:hypothetical protein
MFMKNHGRMISIGENRRTRRITYPSATSFTTNPTWTDPGANPGFRDESYKYGNSLCHSEFIMRKSEAST